MKDRIVIAGLCLIAVAPFVGAAHTGVARIAGERDKVLVPALVEERCPSENVPVREFEVCRKQKADGRESESTEFAHAVLSESGTLASVLGERVYEIDSIAVEGPVNDADFNTLWDSSFNGRLKIINLGNAVVEGGKIPDRALFHIDAQMDWETWTVTTIPLEKIVFPDDVTEIGEFAVAYAISLNEIKWPKALQTIDKSAFTDCISLTSERLAFPGNLEVIGEQAFYQCRGLEGKITLPESLKSISCAAFYCCKISEINFPQSLEFLGCMAFANSALGKAILPDNCKFCSEGGQFYNNWYLAEAHLPDNSTLVPSSVFSGCFSLKEVNVPSHVVSIGEFAFDQVKMSKIDFPETLESIGQNAFQSCNKLTSIVLPTSLKSLGDRAFALCGSLTNIWCKANIPPVYVTAQGYESDGTPFTSVNPSIPVYIPIGTKQQYAAAHGWNYMTNFIETDTFPSSAIDGVFIDGKAQDGNIYDLCGRRIETPVPGNIYIQNGQKILVK